MHHEQDEASSSETRYCSYCHLLIDGDGASASNQCVCPPGQNSASGSGASGAKDYKSNFIATFVQRYINMDREIKELDSIAEKEQQELDAMIVFKSSRERDLKEFLLIMCDTGALENIMEPGFNIAALEGRALIAFAESVIAFLFAHSKEAKGEKEAENPAMASDATEMSGVEASGSSQAIPHLLPIPEKIMFDTSAGIKAATEILDRFINNEENFPHFPTISQTSDCDASIKQEAIDEDPKENFPNLPATSQTYDCDASIKQEALDDEPKEVPAVSTPAVSEVCEDETPVKMEPMDYDQHLPNLVTGLDRSFAVDVSITPKVVLDEEAMIAEQQAQEDFFRLYMDDSSHNIF